MTKRKGLSYEEKMILALSALPNPLIDKKHNISIYFDNDKARSNQTRFDHIINSRHELFPSDIKHIPQKMKTCILRKDKERKETFNLYLKRNSISNDYIKLSLKIEENKPNIAIVKTIFITKTVK